MTNLTLTPDELKPEILRDVEHFNFSNNGIGLAIRFNPYEGPHGDDDDDDGEGQPDLQYFFNRLSAVEVGLV